MIMSLAPHVHGLTWSPIVQTNQRSTFVFLTNESNAKKQSLEGVPIVHHIVPEVCDQSRAIREICGGGTHHSVRCPRFICTAFIRNFLLILPISFYHSTLLYTHNHAPLTRQVICLSRRVVGQDRTSRLRIENPPQCLLFNQPTPPV